MNIYQTKDLEKCVFSAALFESYVDADFWKRFFLVALYFSGGCKHKRASPCCGCGPARLRWVVPPPGRNHAPTLSSFQRIFLLLDSA